MKVPGFLKNKYVCYALMALAALNVIGYLTVKAWECLALFLLTAYSAHCYCKDKSCAILAALFVANFVFGCGRVKEGFAEAMKGPAEHMQEAMKEANTAAEKCEDAQDAAACGKVGAAAGEVSKICAWNDQANNNAGECQKIPAIDAPTTPPPPPPQQPQQPPQ